MSPATLFEEAESCYTGLEGCTHTAEFMTITFDVADTWRERIPEVVHEDGTARVQVVNREAHPQYHSLLEHMQRLTGNGVVLNTSLNRRGEPIVCTPEDALNMFFGCDLEYLMLEDYLVTKSELDAPGPSQVAYPDRESDG